jgi:hypothetical protein
MVVVLRTHHRRHASSVKGRLSLAMRFRCLDCNEPIEGDPWWYDPLAVGIQLGVAVATVHGVVTERPYAPTSVAGPFHKDCLIRPRFLN